MWATCFSRAVGGREEHGREDSLLRFDVAAEALVQREAAIAKRDTRGLGARFPAGDQVLDLVQPPAQIPVIAADALASQIDG